MKRNKESLLAQAQLLLTPPVLHAASLLGRGRGIDKNDFAELLMMVSLGDEIALQHKVLSRTWGDPAIESFLQDCSQARWLLNAFALGEAVDVPRTDRRGDRTYGAGLLGGARVVIDTANVVAFRMAHRQDVDDEIVPQSGGYSRGGLGMSLAMTAEQVWERSRGYWRIRPDAEYTLPTRLGYAPYLFKVADWRTASDATDPSAKTARYWAQSGWVVDYENRRLIPVDGSPEQEASDFDLSLAEKFAGKVVRFPLGIRNPAVWIGRVSTEP